MLVISLNSMHVHMWEVTFVLRDVVVVNADGGVFGLDDAIIVFVMMMVAHVLIKQLVHDDLVDKKYNKVTAKHAQERNREGALKLHFMTVFFVAFDCLGHHVDKRDG